MAEGGGDHRPRVTSEGQRIGRRGFAKGLAATGVISGAGTLAAVEAPRIRERRFETPLAYYDPHYEVHFGDPIAADDLPDDINIFSRESVARDRSHREPSEMLLHTAGDQRFQEPRRVFPDDIIEKVAANNGFLMAENSTFPVELTAPGAIIDVLAAGKGLSMIMNEYKAHRSELGKLLNRRQVSKAGVGLFAWGVSGGAGAAAAVAGTAGSGSLERIASRVNALQSKVHPELALVLFRDALKAEKMSTVAEEFGKTYGHKPRVSYVLGYAHTGVEDFLRHPDLARMVIAGYPQEVLLRAVEGNNGVQQFSTTSLYQIESPSSGRPLADRIAHARRYDVVDNKLENLLNKYMVSGAHASAR